MSASTAGWIVLLSPLAGTLVLALFGRSLPGRTAGYVGTLAILLLAVVGFLTRRPEFLDIGLTYGLLNLIGTLAVLRFFRHGDLAYDVDEEGRP